MVRRGVSAAYSAQWGPEPRHGLENCQASSPSGQDGPEFRCASRLDLRPRSGFREAESEGAP